MRENIEVIHSHDSTDPASPHHSVVITDQKAQRAWSGTGRNVAEAATEATRKMLGDRRVREYVE